MTEKIGGETVLTEVPHIIIFYVEQPMW